MVLELWFERIGWINGCAVKSNSRSGSWRGDILRRAPPVLGLSIMSADPARIQKFHLPHSVLVTEQTA
ncbi:MAG: hypothetical protein ACO3FE_10930, partial [Planctomycetaceae bacterium]